MTDDTEKPKRGRIRQRGSKEMRGRVAWLRAARVVDMDAFHRLREQGCGAKKLGRALSTTVATAQKLMAGTHWQQNPEKVAEFNRFHHASVDPATGVPTANDLIKHGGADTRPKGSDSEGEKDLRRIIEDAGGIAPKQVTEAMRRLRLLAGAEASGDLPEVPDTKYFQDTIDKKLAMILSLMDSVTLAGASVADLTRAANMLLEKRALLRGEPTAIVRNEHRGGLDKLAEMLAAELGRRGMAPAVDMPKSTYREVTE